jgi:hypothetical protein
MRKLLISIILLVSVAANAATYYISPTGMDRSDYGTNAYPWKTIAYACSRVTVSGDIIHVKAGSYTEIVQSALFPGVSIEGEGETSVIHSIVGDDFTISLWSRTEGTNGNQHISNLKFDGSSLAGFAAIYICRRSNVHIFNCTFQNFEFMALSFFGGGSDEVEPTRYASGNKVYGCTIDNCSIYYWDGIGNPKSDGWGYGAIMINGQTQMEIYDNTLTQDSRSVGLNGYLIKGCDFGFNKELKIYNNIINKLGLTGNETASNRTLDFAIELWNNMGEVEIYNNIITGAGIDLSGHFGSIKGAYPYGTWIHDNQVGYSTISKSYYTAAIFLEGRHEATIIERNFLHDVDDGVWIPIQGTHAGIYDTRISYNIFENMGVADGGPSGSGAAVEVLGGETTKSSGIDGLEIYNNVMIGHNGSASNYYGIAIPSQSGGVTNVNIRNNIIRYFDNGPVSLGFVSSSNITDNILNTNGNSNIPTFSGTCTVANNLTCDPLFVSTSDFHLQGTSPALNRGYDVNLPLDYDSVAVNASTPEIGAYEYVTGTATQVTVTAADVTSLTSTTPVSGGNVTYYGGATVTARGLCWKASANPTTSDCKTTEGTGPEAFILSITGLSKNITY